MTPREIAARRWPEDRPDFLPLLPFIHFAWADGALTPEEIEAVAELLDSGPPFPPDARARLAPWLDPDAPPSPSELYALLGRIRRDPLDDAAEATASLTDLGLALAAAAGDPAPWDSAVAVERLRALEASLGVLGRDAARRALGVPALARTAASAPTGLDLAALRDLLDADHRELRDEVIALLAREPLALPGPLPSEAYRARVLEAVRFLADRGYGAIGFPREYGGTGDPSAGVAVFESLAFGDLSTLVKYGVQFGLFGGSVLTLGTRSHHDAYLRDIGSLALPGCYAMTETGHGSNVRDLETTATYDPDGDELVVHTPHEDAGKDWIGNAALHGRLATVFARLVVAGEDHGVHALLVPLRDGAGRLLPGVRIEDRGEKEGLNGVDNGRIWFDEVRVPRANLLDRFASIDADGTYRSEIPSAGRRFFTMLGTLVAGRISIAAASVSAAKTGLAIAVRYAEHRRQFGPEGSPEVPILDYLALQRSLLPRLARTYGLHFAIREMQARMGRGEPSPDPELEVGAAGLKAVASRHCIETLQACREACGGQGYGAANRFGALKADTDVFATFEGANPVLLQLVAKGLLSRFKHEVGDLHFWGTVRYLAERAGSELAAHNPVLTRRTDPEHLRDPDFHGDAFGLREERLLRSAAMRLKRRIDDGADAFTAINQCQDHLLELARAHVDRVVLEAFQRAVARASTPGLSEVLAITCALYALSTIEDHRGWFLESGYLEPNKAKAVRAQVNALCGEVRETARFLIDGFGIPDEVLRAPAALAAGA